MDHRKKKSFPRSPSEKVWAGSLYGVSVGESRVRPGGWLKWLALVVLCARITGRHPGFAPSSSEVAVCRGGRGGGRGGRKIGLFVNCCLEFAPTAHAQLFLAPYSFFVFFGLRWHLSRCKHCLKGSQVPTCRKGTSSTCPKGKSHPVEETDPSLYLIIKTTRQ